MQLEVTKRKLNEPTQKEVVIRKENSIGAYEEKTNNLIFDKRGMEQSWNKMKEKIKLYTEQRWGKRMK